jgi:hypothetical protein
VDRGGTCTPCRPFHRLPKRRSSIRQSAVLSEEPCHQNPLPSAQHQSCHPLRSAPVGSGEWGTSTRSVTTNKGTTTNGYRNAHLAQKLKLFIKRVKAQIRSFFKWWQTSNNLASAIFRHSKVPKEQSRQVRAAARTLRKNRATQFNAFNLRMLHKPYLEAISLVNKKLLPFC